MVGTTVKPDATENPDAAENPGDTVTPDDEIRAAQHALWDVLRIVVEPSARRRWPRRDAAPT